MTLDNKLFPSKEPAAGKIYTYIEEYIYILKNEPKTAKLDLSLNTILLGNISTQQGS